MRRGHGAPGSGERISFINESVRSNPLSTVCVVRCTEYEESRFGLRR